MTALTLPTIGTALPHLGGTLGAYVARPDGSMRGLIVCDAEHEFTAPWGPRKRIAKACGIDGLASTRAMAKAGSQTAARVLELKAGGFADWYMASRLEWLALQQCAPELFKRYWYWTSTQFSASDAWCQAFGIGDQLTLNVSAEGGVRAVRSFDLQDFIASAGAA